jgi:hypothetical protein
VGVVARLVHRLDYVRLCGLVAGSMTDPPALAFGNALLGGDAASTIYAAVYPLTMLLRVVTAQILALAIVGGGQSLSRPAQTQPPPGGCCPPSGTAGRRRLYFVCTDMT